VICFHQQARNGQECYFRRIEFYDEEQDRVLVFVTNHPATLAGVHKRPWPMKLFFKAMKRSLRIKTFVSPRTGS